MRSEAYRRERREKAEVIARLCGEELRKARRIADLGAGTGIIKKALEITFSKPIIGIELNASFIRERGRMVVGDVTRLPLADGTLDFAVLNHLYEHVEDQEGLFRELARVLRPGGTAYVSAGSRLAFLEPHYRLPLLSWLPRPAADLYLRLTGRGRCYRGVRFRTHPSLMRTMRKAGLEVEDRTAEALDRLLGTGRDGAWERLWRAARRLPAPLVTGLLAWFSPQWFLRVRRPAATGGDPENASGEAA